MPVGWSAGCWMPRTSTRDGRASWAVFVRSPGVRAAAVTQGSHEPPAGQAHTVNPRADDGRFEVPAGACRCLICPVGGGGLSGTQPPCFPSCRG